MNKKNEPSSPAVGNNKKDEDPIINVDQYLLWTRGWLIHMIHSRKNRDIDEDFVAKHKGEPLGYDPIHDEYTPEHHDVRFEAESNRSNTELAERFCKTFKVPLDAFRPWLETARDLYFQTMAETNERKKKKKPSSVAIPISPEIIFRMKMDAAWKKVHRPWPAENEEKEIPIGVDCQAIREGKAFEFKMSKTLTVRFVPHNQPVIPFVTKQDIDQAFTLPAPDEKTGDIPPSRCRFIQSDHKTASHWETVAVKNTDNALASGKQVSVDAYLQHKFAIGLLEAFCMLADFDNVPTIERVMAQQLFMRVIDVDFMPYEFQFKWENKQEEIANFYFLTAVLCLKFVLSYHGEPATVEVPGAKYPSEDWVTWFTEIKSIAKSHLIGDPPTADVMRSLEIILLELMDYQPQLIPTYLLTVRAYDHWDIRGPVCRYGAISGYLQAHYLLDYALLNFDERKFFTKLLRHRACLPGLNKDFPVAENEKKDSPPPQPQKKETETERRAENGLSLSQEEQEKEQSNLVTLLDNRKRKLESSLVSPT